MLSGVCSLDPVCKCSQYARARSSKRVDEASMFASRRHLGYREVNTFVAVLVWSFLGTGRARLTRRSRGKLFGWVSALLATLCRLLVGGFCPTASCFCDLHAAL